MTEDQREALESEPAYRSGMAARLAGIPVETLRVWERRYQVVGPRVTARGHRLYSAEEVSRLAVIRHLVDLGNPIGSVANLPLPALRAMRVAAAAASHGGEEESAGLARRVRVALIGAALEEQVTSRDGGGASTFEVVATSADQAAATEALRGISADLVAIALPTLHADAVTTVDALVQCMRARHAIIEYRCAPAEVLRALRTRGHKTVRAPLDFDELERICRDAMAPGAMQVPRESSLLPLEAVPSRRFDDPSLARIARALTTLHCECPHHVVEILLSLGTFERYSGECAALEPADAELHRHLQRVAGSARAMFEDALVRIARSEKLALPVGSGNAGSAGRTVNA